MSALPGLVEKMLIGLALKKNPLLRNIKGAVEFCLILSGDFGFRPKQSPSRCPDQLDKYLQTGKRCSTNRKPKIGLLCGEHAVDFGHDGGSLSHGCRDAFRRTRSHITYRENADPIGL